MSQCLKTDAELFNQASQFSNHDLLCHIKSYWSRRAKGFGKIRKNELGSDKLMLWSDEILPYLPTPKDKKRLRVLDVGTGAGFFAILLAQQANCEVIGIDLCPDMLREAEALARECGCSVRFFCMDATDLDFDDNSFDCLLVRNLTWTLLRPEAAYAEWLRVLRPQGILLNFDADYGKVDFTDFAKQEGQHAHADLDWDELCDGENIRKRLPLSQRNRPTWDVAVLRKIGFRHVVLDKGLSKRVYTMHDSFYNPVPMFALRAIK